MNAPKSKRQPEKIVPALYLGERVGMTGAINQTFRLVPTGRIVFFSGIRNVYPGDCYAYDEANGTMAVKPKAIQTPDKMTDTEQKEFELHKELAKHRRLEKRKALELKKPHPDIVRAINLLRPFVRNANVLELRRFTGYLENQLSAKRKK